MPELRPTAVPRPTGRVPAWFCCIVAGLFAILGSALMVSATARGIGTSPDSVLYIAAARNFAAARGLHVLSADGGSIPVTAVPPLYPVVLGIVAWFGVDPFVSARWLNVGLFGLNLLLIGSVIARFTNGSIAAVALGCTLALTATPLLAIHASAWSEPLFIFWWVLGAALLSESRRQRSLWLIALAAIAVGLAWLTRYVGVALVAAAVVWILQRRPEPWTTRVTRAALFVFIASLPMALWLIRNTMVAMDPVGRSLAPQAIPAERLLGMVHTIQPWLIPEGLDGLIRALLIVSMVALAWFIGRWIVTADTGAVRRAVSTSPGLFGVIPVFYLGVVLMVLATIDRGVKLDYRTLSTVYVAVLIFGLSFCHRLALLLPRRALVALAATVVLWSGAHVQTAFRWVRTSSTGLWAGFASPEFRQSEVVASVMRLSPETPIFSNSPEVIYVLSGRTVFPLPFREPEGERMLLDQMGGSERRSSGGA